MNNLGRWTLGVGLLSLGLWAGLGCGDDGGNRQVPGPSGGSDIQVSADTGAPDAGPAAPDAGSAKDTTPPPGANQLHFQYTVDGTGQPCSQSCTQPLASGETFEIAVAYTQADGAPIGDALIVFATTAAPDQLKVGAKSAYTNAEGKASMQVTAGPTGDGNYEVRISANDDPDAGTLSQKIFVDAAKVAPLKVDVDYQGNQNISAFELRLFLREGGKPLCSDVHPDAPGVKPTPVMKKENIGPTETATFGGLPGLETAGTQTWIVQVVGPSGGPATAVGCRDDVVVTDKETAQTTVTVIDLPKQFQGTYDAVTWVDLYTGLSGTAGTILELLVGLFDTPGETAIIWACNNASGSLATVCNFLVSGGDLTAAGIAIANTGNDLFLELMADNLPPGVFFTGTSLADLLKTMRLGSVLTFDQEPDLSDTTSPTPTFPANSTHEEWTTATFQWKFDATLCPPGTEDCPKTVKLEEVYGYKLKTAGFGAGITAQDAVTLEKHAVVGFNYGVLINFILEKQILPLAFGDGTEPGPQGGNLPAIDSYDKVIATIFGDKWCLYYDDCCDWFMQKEGVQSFINDYTGGSSGLQFLAEQIAHSACEAAPGAGGSWIRGQVNSLGADLEIGTPAGQGCLALDFDGDRKVDNLGTESQKCVWDASFDFSGQPFTPDNSWTAKHK